MADSFAGTIIAISGEGVEVKAGDRVHTKMDRFPVSTGRIEFISHCGRYARVRKRYGVKRNWAKVYHIKDLEKLRELK